MARKRNRLDPGEVKRAMQEKAGNKAGAPFHSPFAAVRDELANLVPRPRRQVGAKKPEEPTLLAQTRAKYRSEREALSASVVPARRGGDERGAKAGSRPGEAGDQRAGDGHYASYSDDSGDDNKRGHEPPAAPAELDLFADEMAGVARLTPDPRGRVSAPPPAPAPVSRRALDEAEAYAVLADLVDGQGPFTISETEEHLEFLAPGLDRRLIRKLRRGDYAMQGHIDLHGHTQLEAYRLVEDFIERSRSSGKRCVLIVHGRGLHSKDEIPVLKDRVRKWLERGRMSRSVLAFASARPCDGGTGALYVLLRR